MDKELKIAFTRRLSQCNKSEMIVIIYDIYFAYSDQAKKQFEEKDKEGWKESVRKAAAVLTDLIGALDPQYEISNQLRSIYQYCKTALYKTLSDGELKGLQEADHLLGKLRNSFKQIAENDHSESVMKNSQTVYAGITYGKGNLVENCDYSVTRGFFA